MEFAQSKSRGRGKSDDTEPKTESGLDQTASNSDVQRQPSYALGHGVPPGLSLLGGAIQAKLAVGAANDPYEREADSVAEQVTSGKTVGQPPAVSSLAPGALTQAKHDKEKKTGQVEEEPVQRQTEEEETPVQTAAEEEPEETPVQRQPEKEEEPVQAKSTKPDQKPEEEEEEGANEKSANREAEREVRNRGGGEPMPDETRGQLEPRLGVDLSDVRVHTGAQSEQATKSLRARAFTNRNHIWLAPGERANDMRLMAHELTHVIQQNGVARRPPVEAKDTNGVSGKPSAESTSPSPGAQSESAAETKPAPIVSEVAAGTATANGAAPPRLAPAEQKPATVTPDAIATPESKSAAEVSSPIPTPATNPLAEPRPDVGVAQGLAPGAPSTTAPVAQPLQAPAGGLSPSGGPSVAGQQQTPLMGAGLATPEAKGPATDKTGTAEPASPSEAKSKAEAEAKETTGQGIEGEEKEAAEGKQGEKGAPEAGAGTPPAADKDALGAAGLTAGETGPAAAPASEMGAGKEASAGAGGVSTETGAAGEEAGANAEQTQAEAEQRMAAAAGEKEAGSEGEAAGEATADEQAPAETSSPAEEAAQADKAAAEMVPDAAAGGASEAGPANEVPSAESEAAPGGGGAALAEAETAADQSANEERAATEEAESPQPAPGEPSSAELASAGAPELAENAQAAESTPEVGATAEETPEATAPSAAETGATSTELSPAERDAATASVTEGAGGEAEPSGGGGGGGGAIPEKTEPEVPDVSASDPAQAMAQISNLPPGKMATALTGVNAAVTRSVGEQRSQLAESPPQMERPSGSPVTKQGPSQLPGGPPSGAKAAPPERVPEGQAKPTPQPEPLPAPPPSPAQSIAPPQVKGDEKGELSEADVSNMKSSISSLPTRDPGLETSAGSAPTVAMEGNADPSQTQQQRAKLEQSVAETQAQGQRDAAQPMGEGEIYPTIQPETLRAKVPAGGGGGAAGGAGGAGATGETEDAVSIIAQEKSGSEIQAAAAKAQGDMAAERSKHNQKAAEEQAKSKQEIAKLEADNAAQQQGERTKAQAEAQKARQDWTEEQQKAIEKRREEADKVNEKGAADIETAKTEGEEQAAQKIEEGNQEAASAQAEGEQKAEAEKQRGEEESSGFFGWLSSKAKSFFNSIKEGIKSAMAAARRAVKAAIEKAKQLAVALIEKARQAIVAAIRWVGDQLIAIGDKLLADFPGLRDRFRSFIKEKVAAAEAAVNKLADALKEGVQKALDLLGAALDAALGLLEKGLLAAVDVVNAVVQGAIKVAKAVADAIGVFVVLIKDIAAAPGQWISNLGAAVVDGIKNHLWKAFKLAVKNWFNQKLEEVLGLGAAIWGVLTKGGIKLAEIGKMAWEGVKSAIPIALVQILVEKLVAMIVPAAGAIMAIIEGLQAAWGTISRILQAIQLFINFLKAVKSGNAGPQFANAVAAAAIVVIDFVANWLVRRIKKPAGKVGGAIKAMAQRILQKLKSVAKKIGKKLKGIAKKIGGKLKKFGAKIKSKFKKITGKFKKKKGKKPKKSKEQKRHERQRRAYEAARAVLNRLLMRGASARRVKLTATYLRLRYGFRTMQVVGGKDSTIEVLAGFSPGESLTKAQRQTMDKAIAKAQAEGDTFDAVEVRILKKSKKSIGDLMTGTQRAQLKQAIKDGLRQSGRPYTSADVEMLFAPLLTTKITVILGTTKLRMLYKKLYEEKHEEAEGEIHHLIPLYLGGAHKVTNLLDLRSKLHKQVHKLFRSIGTGKGPLPSLHPSTLRALYKGNARWAIAVIKDDGRIEYREVEFKK